MADTSKTSSLLKSYNGYSASSPPYLPSKLSFPGIAFGKEDICVKQQKTNWDCLQPAPALPNSKLSKNHVRLDRWIIKPLGVGICVEGHRRFDPDDEFWHSSLITERLHRRVVCSSSGTTYKLVGKIVKPLALAQGFSSYVVEKFCRGFPDDWRSVLSQHDTRFMSVDYGLMQSDDLSNVYKSVSRISITENTQLIHESIHDKQYVHLKQEKIAEDCIQPALTSVSSKPFKKHVELDRWIIKPRGNGICVEGHRRFDPDDEFWHSSLITERLHRRIVCSSTGTTYKLVGKIVKSLALAQGFSSYVVEKFCQGFPDDWRSVLSQHDTRFGSPDRGLIQSYDLTDVYKSAPSTSSMEKTQLIHDIADCPTSRRSGRHIIPPLAFWASERMLIDPITHVSRIVCDSPLVKTEGSTDNLSCSLTPRASNFRNEGPLKNKCLGIRVKRQVSLQISASIVKGTDSLICMKDIGREERRHRAGKLSLTMHGYHSSSGNKIINKQDMNGSERKRAVKKTDTKIGKVSSVVSDGVIRHCHRSRRVSTAAVKDKVKNAVTQKPNKNTQKRKRTDVEKTSDVLLDMHSTMPTKKQTVNSCTKTCTHMSRTGKASRKVRNVQHETSVTGNEGLSLSSSFGLTKKLGRKMTGSHVVDDKAARKDAGSVTICSEVKNDVTDARKESIKEHEATSSPADSSVIVSSDWRGSCLQTAAVVHKHGEGVVNEKHTLQETFRKHELPLPCRSIGNMTLQSVLSGNKVCKQACRSDCSEMKPTETVKEKTCENKYTSQCSNVDVTSQSHRTRSRLGTDGSLSSLHMTLRPRQQQQSSVIVARKSQTLRKRASTVVCSDNSTTEIGKVVKVHKAQSPFSNLNVTQTLREADCLDTVDSLCEDNNSVVDVSEANISTGDTVPETLEKHKGAAVGHQASVVDDFAAKSDVTGRMNKTLKNRECESQGVNFDMTVQPRETENVCTEAAAVCRNVSNLMDTTFHMMLRPRRQRQQCSMMTGRKSLAVSDPVRTKPRSVNSEDKENTSRKPCRKARQRRLSCR